MLEDPGPSLRAGARARRTETDLLGVTEKAASF